MPANPMFDKNAKPCMVRWEGSNTKRPAEGETKYEKAFWQVYSAMLADPEIGAAPYTDLAEYAISAVNAGFKALEKRND